MALSNWDHFVLDVNLDKPSAGLFQTPSEYCIELYKNWLYMCEPEQETPCGRITGDCEMTWQNMYIRAWFGPQNGIYAVVYTSEWTDGKQHVKGMVCAGVYGFEDHEWVGVLPASIEWFQGKIREEESLPEEIRTLSLKEGTRYNAGDAFFAVQLGTDPPQSKPGEPPSEPIITQMIKAMDENG